MKSIREAGAQTLTWQPSPKLKGAYQLLSGEEVVGTLQWQKGFSLVLAEAAEGSWTFKRTGFLNPKVTVRPAGSDTDLAAFTPLKYTFPTGVVGGVIEFSDGRKYNWTSPNPLAYQWTFSTTAGEPLIHMKPMRLLWKASDAVELTPAGFALPDASLLIMVGWYALLLASSEAGAMMGAFIGIIAS